MKSVGVEFSRAGLRTCIQMGQRRITRFLAWEDVGNWTSGMR